MPIPWDGTLDDLPSGWDEGFVLGMTTDREPTALMAVAISVAPARQGERLSSRMIETFKDNARAAGLTAVLAPVRPTHKERYPLIPIETLPRVAARRRLALRPVAPDPRARRRRDRRAGPESMVIAAPVADWEEWTGMPFPADGDYIFPGGLAPLVVRDGVGTHVEPNVWVLHRV